MDDVADVDDAAPDRAAPPREDDRRPGATTRTLARAGIIVTVAFAISRILGYLITAGGGEAILLSGFELYAR